MKNKVCIQILTLIISFNFTYSQVPVRYKLPGLNNYFMSYKNGHNIDYLNDSLKTSFYKFNDSSFKIKFYLNNIEIKICECKFSGNQEFKISKILRANQDGTRGFIKQKYLLKYLILSDPKCLDFIAK